MAYRWLGVLALLAACSFGCENSGVGDPRGDGGAGGVGGSGGDGGAGGAIGTGGTAGAGGSQVSCTTSVLCRSCPSEGFCETNDDCSVGSVCIESGCSSAEGSAIKQCVFAGGGACDTTADCLVGRECMEVPDEGNRCVKTTSGCDNLFDCVPGFSCEAGSCVDRRVPCERDPDCPKNHTCFGTMSSSFCVRIQRDCLEEFDCIGLAPRCEDIDGDGNKECAGVFEPNQHRSAKRRAREAGPRADSTGFASLTRTVPLASAVSNFGRTVGRNACRAAAAARASAIARFSRSAPLHA